MITTDLECGHALHWRSLHTAPKLNESIWCQECKDMRHVVSLPGSWYAKCCECKWKAMRMHVESIRDQIRKHVNERGHVINLRNHDGSERYTVRTSHYAASVGNHSASVAAMARVLPRSGPDDTLF